MKLNNLEAKKIHNNQKRIHFNELKDFDNIKAIRLKFVSDSNFPSLDFSYLLIKADGKEYKVDNVPFYQLSKKNWKTELFNILKKEGIYIKDLFDVVSIG